MDDVHLGEPVPSSHRASWGNAACLSAAGPRAMMLATPCWRWNCCRWLHSQS